MNTLEELQNLANQGKLDEIDTLAALAQKWRYCVGVRSINDLYARDYWQNEDGSEGEYVDEYHPTRNKAQAWDLAVKGELSVYINNFKINGKKINTAEIGKGLEVDHKDPLIAVTIAFILARQGEE